MKISRIHKLYLSNFLTGLVFWYGIEKLFMRSIGIDAVGVGATAAVFLVFNLIFDIPAGILADKWSRRGVLIISSVSLAVCSVLMGSSHGLLLYSIAELFYGMYIVSTSGTYSAITYDILHEENKADDYSRISGRAYALFLVGAGVANVASGFIAHSYGYRSTYFITVASCLLNVAVLLNLHEPAFHKNEKKERALRQLKEVSLAISKIKLLRSLTIVLTGLAVIDLFSSEFGQLYMLRYFSSVQVIGLLWALYAFAWAFGSFIAHRFRGKLNAVVVGSVVPFIVMAFIDNWFSLVLFMLQVIAAAVLVNQTETRIQENTPSAVRASVLSVVSTLGRAVSIPASFAIGLLVRDYNTFVALRFIGIISGLLLLYWLWSRHTVPSSAKL